MKREVFVLPDGESCFVWNVQFTAFERRKESRVCNYQEDDGSMRKGIMHYTLESSQVSFCALPGSLRVGMHGQVSSSNDIFFDVEVLSVQPGADHVVVSGRATRMFGLETDR